MCLCLSFASSNAMDIDKSLDEQAPQRTRAPRRGNGADRRPRLSRDRQSDPYSVRGQLLPDPSVPARTARRRLRAPPRTSGSTTRTTARVARAVAAARRPPPIPPRCLSARPRASRYPASTTRWARRTSRWGGKGRPDARPSSPRRARSCRAHRSM